MRSVWLCARSAACFELLPLLQSAVVTTSSRLGLLGPEVATEAGWLAGWLARPFTSFDENNSFDPSQPHPPLARRRSKRDPKLRETRAMSMTTRHRLPVGDLAAGTSPT